MKKILPLVLVLFLSLLFSYLFSFFSGFSVLAAEAGNKFGLNVAARVDHVDRGIATYLKQDGWIVMMPAAPNYSSETSNQVVNEIVGSYFSKLGSQVNYILRAHYPHASNPNFASQPTFPDTSDSQWAVKWADFWAGIINNLPIPAGSAFYVIPWNEPNLQRECSGIGNAYDPNDCGCVSYVLEYISQLEARLDRNKAKLLTPALAVSAPNFYSFSQCLGGAGFFNRFDGVALDYYDFETGCNQPFCNPNPMFNPNKYPQLLSNIGASGKKLFMVETGLVSPSGCEAGVPDCPNFSQPDITLMLCQLYNNHKNDPNFVMFSPLTYNPERSEGNWFWDTSQTKDFYLERSEDCSLIKEKTIVLGDNSAVRSNWTEINFDEREESLGSPSPSPQVYQASRDRGERTADGKLIFSQQRKPKLPGLIQMTPNFVHAFRGLLTSSRAQNASLSFQKTMMKTTSYVIPYILDSEDNWTIDNTYEAICSPGEPRDEEDVAKHEWPVPGSWSGFVTSSTGVAGMVLPASRTTNLDLYQYFRYQMPELDWLCDIWSHKPGPEGAPEDMGTPDNEIKPEFRVTLLVLIEQILDAIKNILHIQKTEMAEVKVNAQLAAGENAKQKSGEIVSAFAPNNVRQKFKARGDQTLDGDVTATVFLSPGEETTQPLLFADQLSTRNDACNTLCSSYPERRTEDGSQPWIGINNICPSCNPKEYQWQTYLNPNLTPGPRPPDAHEICQWDESIGGCHYYQPGLEQQYSCEGDRCNPYSLPPPGIGFSDDSSCVNECHLASQEEINSCHYISLPICLRNDGVGGCASICNWACCAYQN